MGKIILFLLLFYYVFLQECEVYKCMDDTDDKGENACLKTNKNAEGKLINYSVRLCPSGKVCLDRSEGENDTKVCKEPEDEKSSEGEYCEEQDDCYRGICKERKCVVLKNEESCNKSEECQNHFYCDKNNNTCRQLKSEGDECESDDECDYFQYCAFNSADKKAKYCLLQYSYNAGKYVSNEKICRSGKANNNICYDTKPVGREEGNECQNNSECKIDKVYGDQKEKDEDFGECLCSYAKNKKYCSYTSSSDKWKRILLTLDSVLEDYEEGSIDVLNARKLDYWDDSDIKRFMARFDVRLKGAPDCLFEYFLTSKITKFSASLFVLLFSLFYL